MQDMLRNKLPKLSPRMQLAFVGGCARRVFDILLVSNLISPDLPRQALAILTKHVENSEFSVDE